MGRLVAVMLLLTMVAFGKDSGKPRPHPDYVPDQKTAERIAEAILVAQYGEERVNPQLPLHADGSDKDYWVVQGYVHESGIPKKGGGFAVWINKHSGSVKVMEHMK